MKTRRIDRAAWQSVLDGLADQLKTKQVEIEVDSLDLGSQIEAEWVHVSGCSYDPRDDAIYVVTDSLEHQIANPRELWIVEDGGAVQAIEAVDGEGTKQILRFRSPVMIPEGVRG